MRTAVPTAAGGGGGLAAWKTHDAVGLTRLLCSSLVVRHRAYCASAEGSPGRGRPVWTTRIMRRRPRQRAPPHQRSRLLVDPRHELAQLLAGGLQQVLGVL